MHRLDHHYGVVDHNRDGEHESRKGDKVDGEADELHHEERTDKCHRYGDGGNDGGAEVLKEDINHEEHEHERFEQRLEHLMD